MKGWWKRHMSVIMIEGPSDEGLAALENRAGLVTAWYDQRGLTGMANDPDQPQAGFANSHIAATSPGWVPR